MATWKISSEIEPNYSGGLMRAKWLIGGVRTVKSLALRNAIPPLYRFLNTEESTIVFVEEDSQLYRLINNPSGVTTNSDWALITFGNVASGLTPIGTWNINNASPALLDSGASGKNGNFYFVTGAPTPQEVTISGLFNSEPVTLVDGNMIISVGTRWVVVANSTAWTSIDKPQSIIDYVAGTVIAHSHTVDDISDLGGYLADYLTRNDTADHTIAFEDVPDSDIVEVEFLRQFYYNKTDIANLLDSLGDGVTTFLQLLDSPGEGVGAYTGHAGKVVKVNTAEDGLEFGVAENPANKGVANGYASLDADGKVPSGQLPSYVDDVLEYADFASFPATGESGKIYMAIDTNLSYRWGGSAYILISSAPADATESVKGIAEIATQEETNAGAIDTHILTPLKLANAIQDGKYIYGVAAGTNTYTVGFTPTLTALAIGQTFRIKFTNGNTGVVTINPDGLGAIPLKKNSVTDLGSGDIQPGQIIDVAYDGTNFQILAFYGLNITAAEIAAIPAGATNLFTVTKNIDGSMVSYGAGVEQIDNFAGGTLNTLLADTASWVGDSITLTGDNRQGELGQTAQEYVITNSLGTMYKCVAHSLGTTALDGSATWIRTRSRDNDVSGAAVTELQSETGWDVNNTKILTVRSKVGSWYTGSTGYTYFCFGEVAHSSWNWRRIGQPLAIFVQITDATLIAEIEAHNFILNPILTPVATVKGEDRQEHYWVVSGIPHIAQCIDDAGTKKWVLKLRGGSTRLNSTAFTSVVDLYGNLRTTHSIDAAIAYTKGAEVHVVGNVREDFLTADGINKPTFSADFVVVWDNWVNTINTLNIIRFEYLSSGKISVELRWIE